MAPIDSGAWPGDKATRATNQPAAMVIGSVAATPQTTPSTVGELVEMIVGCAMVKYSIESRAVISSCTIP